jgi:hypothetical protein
MIEPEPQSADEGQAAVAAALAEAEQQDQAWLAKLAAGDPVPGDPRNGVAPDEWEADELGLPPDCPVIPLGVDDGVYWFLDTLGQLRALEFGQFGQKAINSLFMGRHHYLYWAWPRFNKDGALVSWRQEKCAEDLMGACARKGPWNAVERARGRGAWTLAEGSLAVHCGTQLYVGGKARGLGELMGDVYMTRPPILHPWPRAITGSKGPAAYLYPLLQTWNWSRPDIDPVLFLGWLGAAMIGGALPWRPVIYMTGDKATGKSTLQRLMKLIFGNALIKSADTTAAGIYQLLKSDALPVAVDELEGKADTRRAKAILELARLASSGDLMLRGGEAHKGTQFNARSCFAFSSINTPPLEPQDLSRMALLRLYRLPEGSVSPDLDEPKLHRMGRMIMRRMMDGWHRFPATFRAYREMLSEAKHDSRGQDQFGTLLACADILMDEDAEHLGVPMAQAAENLASWIEQFKASGMTEYEDAEENWRLCLNHVLSTPIEAWKGGGQQTMGEVLEKLHGGHMEYGEARAMAQKAGLTIVKPSDGHPHHGLFIPNQHPLLNKLFQGSKWQGDLGAGVWSGALRQAPPASYRVGQGRVTGVKGKGTVFDLDVVLNRVGEQPAQPRKKEMDL